MIQNGQIDRVDLHVVDVADVGVDDRGGYGHISNCEIEWQHPGNALADFVPAVACKESYD